MSSSIRSTMLFSLLLGLFFLSLGHANTEGGGSNLTQIYSYQDDFRSDKASLESHQRSVFWVHGAIGPDQPYLVYATYDGQRSILFHSDKSGPAELVYRLPVEPDVVLPSVNLYVEVIVKAYGLSFAEGRKSMVGQLAYSTSSDGSSWSPPSILKAGENRLNLGLLTNNTYLKFIGNHAVLVDFDVKVYRHRGAIQVPGDMPTIQAAIDAAKAGNLIVVADGTYQGEGNYNIDFKGKAISLISENGPDQCTINCEDMGTGFIFQSHEGRQAVLSGFTIQRGLSEVGGGIYIEDASPTITNCVVQNSLCVGTESRAAQGGGLFCKGGEPLIRDCWFLFNESLNDDSGAQGGGLCFIDSGAVLENCVIYGNLCGGYGTDDTYGGAGVYTANESESISSQLLFRGCLVAHNASGTYGGGLLFHGASGEFSYCTIADNQSVKINSGGGVYVTGKIDSVTSFEGCILWNNLAQLVANQIDYYGINGAVAPNAKYCVIQDGWPGEEILNVDPCFVDPKLGDYHLVSMSGRWSVDQRQWVYDYMTSPAVDKGNPGVSSLHESTPDGARVNCGAYGTHPQASRGQGNLIYHVDGVHGDDANLGLSRQMALASIQTAVDLCQHGDTVLVWPGEYIEDVDLDGKKILVQSAGDAATIQAERAYAFSFFKGEREETQVRNFILKSCPEGGILCHAARPNLNHLTIVDCGFGISAFDSGDLVIRNSILWNNLHGDLRACRAEYSCVQHQENDQHLGEGNISRDPRFVDPNIGDYHVQSRFGRYWPLHDVWVVDEDMSPCIDGGDPLDFFGQEPESHGNRVNMGAYGGTSYASRSAPVPDPDLNFDGIVNFLDFAIMAEQWLENKDPISLY